MADYWHENWFVRYYFGETSYAQTFWIGYCISVILLTMMNYPNQYVTLHAFLGSNERSMFVSNTIGAVFCAALGLYIAAVWHTSKYYAKTISWRRIGRTWATLFVMAFFGSLVIKEGNSIMVDDCILRILPCVAAAIYCYTNMKKNREAHATFLQI